MFFGNPSAFAVSETRICKKCHAPLSSANLLIIELKYALLNPVRNITCKPCFDTFSTPSKLAQQKPKISLDHGGTDKNSIELIPSQISFNRTGPINWVANSLSFSTPHHFIK
ncbi:hypothetical protein NPIL_246621 [Nephila pilipes]|uniref:Uncharacterized protein n=1 Tax=Nephila pilipes TaxID=299642 RepID=A0A8X6TTF4_NEPPI|nr:hypothetical protein NPIL_246621 [Nephila pilipes]